MLNAPLGPGFFREDTQQILREGWVQLITPSAPYLNEVSFSIVAEDDVERVIDETIAAYRAIGKNVKWYLGPDSRPLDMGQRLARRGFRRSEYLGMIVETSRPVERGADVHVEHVEAASVDAFVAATIRGWSMAADQVEPERAAHHRALAEVPRSSHAFLATFDGKSVGTAGILMREGYGYLVGGQVFEEARGRGAYRALVDARLQFLRSVHIDYAVTFALETTSAPILERLGFETVARVECWVLQHSPG
ncbi:acetyltransferase, GNAT family [Labilithrix luteola]|uniref:Acetyltransferase, GNAT family n=1 Tax=Labilithrix luteola TaxID=1391654 RepID=A0A0K1PWC7_9BACT|nr:acetyltransferase, GNAT family [Labilithrix luteola]